MSQFELITTKSGVTSLRCREHKETFHPGTGPVIEANILHVQQQRIRERAEQSENFILWDVGLGAAANALAAVEDLQNSSARAEIHSFDLTLAPLTFALENASALGYPTKHREILHALLEKKSVEIRPGFFWHLHLGDFQELVQDPKLPAPHSIFYDPYSPVGNQEMWTLPHFTNLYQRLDPSTPCLFTNYTRSTAVRVTLLLAGFHVGVGCVIGEKAETTVASNCLSLIEKPLGKDWLERVKISRNGAPMRDKNYSIQPINAEDYAQLEQQPQFQLS